MDWQHWHEAYEDPGSSLSRRLEVVRRRVSEALDNLGPGRRRLLSLCAGDARDLLPLLADHPRGLDLTATVVELDPDLAAAARTAADRSGLSDRVIVHQADAGLVGDHFGRLPVDLLLLCGVFGNVPDDDVRRTISALSAFVAPGGRIIWTRGGSTPDQRPVIRGWMTDAGLTEVSFDGAPQVFGVGVHLQPNPVNGRALPARLFAFSR